MVGLCPIPGYEVGERRINSLEKITLNAIQKKNNQITYDFCVSEGLARYFSGKPFVIEYPENIESVPDAVAAVPFVSNVLPIIWLTDSILEMQELDEAFYNCIPEVRKGYETMFPESEFKGQFHIGKIVSCDRPAEGKSAAFFSGGLDAVQTLVSHIDEKPALISIWGADIRYENVEGWEKVHRAIREYADKYNLPDVVIRSSFRDFDLEGVLTKQFQEQLKANWWYGVKHGIGLLGHAAPYAYLHGLSSVYIASSNCPADGPQRCASDPKTDNYVRYASASVIHDGFEFCRQDKTHNIVEYVHRSTDQVTLHVCWESQSGHNCCHCEKCYRTMMELLVEGEDPVDYGFYKAPKTVHYMQEYMLNGRLDHSYADAYWIPGQARMKEKLDQVKRLPYWKDIRWMLKADFSHPESLKMPLMFRIRSKLSRFAVYRALGKLRRKIHG